MRAMPPASSKFSGREMKLIEAPAAFGVRMPDVPPSTAFDAVDRQVILEDLVVVQAAVDGRHAVFFEADEVLAAAGQAADRIVVGDRTRGAFDVDAGDQVQDVGGAARRLLVELFAD